MLSYLKAKYWDFSKRKDVKVRLSLPENHAFSEHIKSERQRTLGLADRGIPGEIQERLDAAINWILMAQQATNDDGVSLGYFPVGPEEGWVPSYPETTGYIVTTLLKYGQHFDCLAPVNAAVRMADWEIEVQMPSGAVQGGPVCSQEQQTPAAFNTGMVADGWMSAYEYTGENKYLDAALRAVRFLAGDLDESGFFRTNGKFVSSGEVKTYTCLCAWAMYRAALAAEDLHVKEAAIRSVEAALRQRSELGWFSNNCLTHSHQPLTHTIGYALQGIFEVGVLSGREDFVAAAKHSLAGALSSMESNGYLSGRLDQKWKPRADYVCLTGSAQLAIVCFRFAEEFNDQQFVPQGHKLTNFVKAAQLLQSENNNMVGAISGSFPIMGEYMKGGYPNWATKYFADALMLQRSFS